MIKLKNILLEQRSTTYVDPSAAGVRDLNIPTIKFDPSKVQKNKSGEIINQDLINQLSPSIMNKTIKLLNTWKENGYVVKIKQTHRSWEQQTGYFKRGKAQIRGGDGLHEYGRAIDVLLIKGDPNIDKDLDSDGTTTSWDKKMRARNVPTPTMLGFAKSQGWEAYGLEWGWDWFHVQYTDEFTNQKGGDAAFICKYGKSEISKLSHVPKETKQKYYKFIDNKKSC